MQPFFLPGRFGQRFCLFHPAVDKKARGAVLYVHPFAEEMNKSRRMAALQSKSLALAGYDVLQIDLLGCGDSSGDFSDATWQAWREDIFDGYRCLRERSQAPLILWGLRAGCLLLTSAAAELPEAADYIFWQPVISGKQYLQQFMRLKMVGDLGSGQVKAIGEQLRQQIAAGQSVEIAGYTVCPGLTRGLEVAELNPPVGKVGRVVWLEASLREDLVFSPAVLKHIERLQAIGISVQASVVHGPAFWQTTEIEDVPELVAATLSALKQF